MSVPTHNLHPPHNEPTGPATTTEHCRVIRAGDVVLQVSSQWPKELEAKQSRLAAVQATLNNGINTEVRQPWELLQMGHLRPCAVPVADCCLQLAGRSSTAVGHAGSSAVERSA